MPVSLYRHGHNPTPHVRQPSGPPANAHPQSAVAVVGMNRRIAIESLEIHPAIHPVLAALTPVPRAAVIPTRRGGNAVVACLLADAPLPVVLGPAGRWWVVGGVDLFLTAKRCLSPDHGLPVRVSRRAPSDAAIQAAFLRERLRRAVSGDCPAEDLARLFETAVDLRERLGLEQIPAFSLRDLADAANKSKSSISRKIS